MSFKEWSAAQGAPTKDDAAAKPKGAPATDQPAKQPDKSP